MVVQHNMSALNSNRQLGITEGTLSKSAEKLSSGFKVNRAADDAAGLSISEKMRKQIRGLNQASENTEDGISFVQVADGALNEVHEMLQRMNELAIQSANGTNSESDRAAIDAEFQQLKVEMERVFETTKFNEEYIWDDSNVIEEQVYIATIDTQVVTAKVPDYQYTTITNDNYNKVALPESGYTILANADGVKVKWKATDGKEYETNNVSWDDFIANDYSFHIGDYFDPDPSKELVKGGKPVFDFLIAFDVIKEASKEDIIAAIDGIRMGSALSASMAGTISGGKGSVTDVQIAYSAQYGSRFKNDTDKIDFEQKSDKYIEPLYNSAHGTDKTNVYAIPNYTTVEAAKNSSDKWQLKFNMPGVGNVTADSSSVSYYASDRDAKSKDKWWRYDSYGNKVGIEYSTGAGTLGDVMSVLKGDKGILSKGKGGDTNAGGILEINFTMTADTPYPYADGTKNTVGGFAIAIALDANDTEEKVLEKLKQAITYDTKVDFSSYVSSSQNTVYKMVPNRRTIPIDHYRTDRIYPDMQKQIHCGSEDTDKLYMIYQNMRVESIGLRFTNALTEESATQAIDEISDALAMVNAERSTFGAYQNRLEHTYRNNQNAVENTQASESKIRDTDMAIEMVRYANNKVLKSAGEAILAQANMSAEQVLRLLQ